MFILNPEFHAEHLASFSEDPAVGRLLVMALANVLRKEPRCHVESSPQGYPDPRAKKAMEFGEMLFRAIHPPADIAEQIHHVRDWLVADLAADAGWLSRLNSDGVPYKLAKIGTMAQAVNEADKAMKRYLSSLVKTEWAEGTEVVSTLANGWTIVKLVTPEALDMESSGMQHCVGQGSYDGHLADGTSEFFSLRDPVGRPHATIEKNVRSRRLVQMQGKQNEHPELRYVEMLTEFLATEFVLDQGTRDMLGILVERSGKWHRTAEPLPEHLDVGGNLDLSKFDHRFLKSLVVGGNLVLATEYPDGKVDFSIRIGGNLSVSKSNIASFRSLDIGGTLLVEHSPLERLPPETRIGDGLKLVSLPNMKELPNDLIVGRSLEIQRVGMTSLPASIKRLDNLVLTRVPITALPETLVVRRKLELRFTEITMIPTMNLAECDVDIGITPIDWIPRNVFGSLRLSISEGAKLQMEDGTEVRRNLSLSGMRMATFPSGVRVGGNLHLYDVEVSSSGSGLDVEGNISVFNTCFMNAMPRNMRCGGDLKVASREIVRLGSGTVVGGDLDCDYSLDELPDGLEVGGRLVGQYGNVFRVGRNTVLAGELDASIFAPDVILSEDLTVGGIPSPEMLQGRLPKGLTVRGSLDLRSYDLEDIPEDLDVRGDLWLPTISQAYAI